MKAVLITDMPDNCLDCKYCGWSNRNEDKRACMLMEGWFFNEDVSEKRSVLCPLKPMPHELQAEWYTDGYKEGFNACLEEITGETE